MLLQHVKSTVFIRLHSKHVWGEGGGSGFLKQSAKVCTRPRRASPTAGKCVLSRVEAFALCFRERHLKIGKRMKADYGGGHQRS